MRYHLSLEEATYFTNLFTSLANGEGVNRGMRRNLQRLANKFSPPRVGVFLKPADKIQVISFAHTGLQVMDSKVTEEMPEAEKEAVLQVYTVIRNVLDKLEGKKTEDYETYTTPGEEITSAAS